jgi:hypothetical protein
MPTFRRNILPPSSDHPLSHRSHWPGSGFISLPRHSWSNEDPPFNMPIIYNWGNSSTYIFLPWRWRQTVPPNTVSAYKTTVWSVCNVFSWLEVILISPVGGSASIIFMKEISRDLYFVFFLSVVAVMMLFYIQGDSFGTRLQRMRISQRPCITFRTYIYE